MLFHVLRGSPCRGDRFTPDFDPDYGDAPHHRTQGHRQRALAGSAGSAAGDRPRVVRARPPDPAARARVRGRQLVGRVLARRGAAQPDALVLRAATEVARAFTLATAAGGRVPVEQRRVDRAVMACLQGAEAYPEDPTPWICLISVARLYATRGTPPGTRPLVGRVARPRSLHDEGHLHVLRYYSARWHGTHGLMYDFARDAAAVAPPGCALPVLVQFARVEEYRFLQEEANGRPDVSVDLDGYWNNEGAVDDVRRTWQRWITARPDGQPAPEEVRDLNYLAHAASYAGLPDLAAPLFKTLGVRASRMPWSRRPGGGVREVAQASRAAPEPPHVSRPSSWHGRGRWGKPQVELVRRQVEREHASRTTACSVLSTSPSVPPMTMPIWMTARASAGFFFALAISWRTQTLPKVKSAVSLSRWSPKRRRRSSASKLRHLRSWR